MNDQPVPITDVRRARELFPATAELAYFNTAAVSLASSVLAAAYHQFVDEWTESGLDFVRGEAAADTARAAVAALIGADPSDVALIASVSAAAGLVSASLEPARSGQNVVIGEREYSSNHFPWRLLANKGYEVRQVPFRNGGLEPGDIERHVDGKTRLVAFSAVQSSTGHRSDIPAISAIARAVGAIVFVDGSQLVGAMPVASELGLVDVLATSDHKFLLNAGRGIGYCYLSPGIQERLTPINAGWKAGAVPFESYYGPSMELSPTASRFDSSISWLAAIGDEAALSVFERFGTDAIYERNRELSDLLRAALAGAGWTPVDLPEANRSTIVAVPLGEADPAQQLRELREQGIVCAARDGNLRLSIHLYNHEDDIERLTAALAPR
ncbi:aminotransferase class V-fold PLP-dependent enzyme [Aquihabitans sp. McL0605]|uniref:aminotransferase class V-fold PLP-dependent enzyme n=1 Tax=Aquihabitans sp. McL0605 TaxID=3415671 RepID=UPI003CF4620A